MTVHIAWLLLAFMAGGTLGIVVAALCVAASRT
jgi:hypothetical protein